MSLDTDRLPYFPPELERHIFEVAFARHGSKISATYLLVARRVNMWLKPLIFKVFNQVISKFPDFERYPNLKVEEVGRFAQRLVFSHAFGMNSLSEELLWLEKMLLHCPNLQDLALWTKPSKFLLPTLEKLSLKRLSANFRGLTHDDYLGSTFSNITHLEVIAFHGRTWKEWEVLSKLPHLSHLIIGCRVDVDVFPNLLLYAPRLGILIFMPERPNSGDMMIHQHPFTTNEDRLVLLIRLPFYDLLQDWSKGGESGLDYWMFCELVSIARKRKFFLDNSQRWFERDFDWDKNLTDEGKKWYSELNWPVPRPKIS